MLSIPPRDGKVYGTYEVDATNMFDFIEKKKQEGTRITVTNVVTTAIARAMFFNVPEMNCFVRRGKLVQREHVGVFLAVAMKGKNVTGFVIPKAESMTVTEIATYQKKKLEKVQAGEKIISISLVLLVRYHGPFRGLVVRFIKWWLLDQGFYFPFLKISRNEPFGSISLSNIGVFGLPIGYLALWPIANLPVVLAMGIIQEKPVVVDGKITIRPMLPISGTFDHRITEADKIGAFKDAVEKRLLNPESLDKPEC